MEVVAVNLTPDNSIVVIFEMLLVVMMVAILVVLTDTPALLMEIALNRAKVSLFWRGFQHQCKKLMWAVLSVQMGNLSVHIHTHVVNFLQVSMAVVLCQMLFAVVMKHFAVLMDTAAMFQLEPASIREKLKWGIMTGYCNFH